MRRGHTFRTTSDTEVILAMYAEYGPECVKRLNGMFAFLMYDRDAANGVRRPRSLRHQAALLPRLRAALCCLRRRSRRSCGTRPSRSSLTSTPIREYLTFQFVTGERTLFSGIHKLRPGHWQLIDLASGRPPRLGMYLGAAVRDRSVPHRGVLRRRSADGSSRMRSGCNCGATCQSAPISVAVWTPAS